METAFCGAFGMKMEIVFENLMYEKRFLSVGCFWQESAHGHRKQERQENY